jgi:hypothetical protein
MKTSQFNAAVVALFLVSCTLAPAATVNWTNTAGGNWTEPKNWSPNQVPSTADTASITANGTYTVSLDADASIGSLAIGGASGTQTLNTATYNVSLGASSTVNATGVFNLQGGILDGGLLTIKGKLNWSDGRFGPASQVSVATNGLLAMVSNGGNSEFGGVVTNAGTITIGSGSWRCIDWGGLRRRVRVGRQFADRAHHHRWRRNSGFI